MPVLFYPSFSSLFPVTLETPPAFDLEPWSLVMNIASALKVRLHQLGLPLSPVAFLLPAKVTLAGLFQAAVVAGGFFHVTVPSATEVDWSTAVFSGRARAAARYFEPRHNESVRAPAVRQGSLRG